jgi:lipoyl(octanoyl) transferase
MRQWRLIDDRPTEALTPSPSQALTPAPSHSGRGERQVPAQRGAWNMGVDEAILASVGAGDAPPTLRLYGWMPPCLSLGYGQRARDADTARIAANGWEIVRRPTGGRAILHADELTYSLSLPPEHPLALEDVVESYRAISRALMAALERLGAAVQAEKADKSTMQIGAVCFETPSHYEITVGGRKLVGSAQVRRTYGVLQHGTLPLAGDIARICDALVYTDDTERDAAKEAVRARALTLETALGGRIITWNEAATAVAVGFRDVFEIDLITGELSEVEREHAARFVTERYANDDWTFRR